MCSLFSKIQRVPVLLFIFMAELFLFLSMFRGSMLQWIYIFHVLFYLMLLVGQRLLFIRIKSRGMLE
ncbi:TPA: hypothetical protein L6A07_27355 [Pseudomonas aeruginosa]|nr:hypothetical protein [Pseudomonas aeruginosa]